MSTAAGSVMTAAEQGVTERAIIISSDGHAVARMRDYRPYLPSSLHEDFDAFCVKHDELGWGSWEPESLGQRLDAETVENWVRDVIEPGRQAGLWDPQARFVEMDRQGISGEVLFPDIGLPFEMYDRFSAALRGYARTPEQVEAGDRAHNRWLADFVSTAPDRFAGMALVSFADIEETMREIRWAKEAGLRGIVIPAFDDEVPLFDARFDPIWSLLEELEMPANSHVAMSSTTKQIHSAGAAKSAPHPGVAGGLRYGRTMFFCHEVLTHLIWGGVLERHPRLQVVFTEQGSGWLVTALQNMDYSFDGRSYMRQDLHEVLKIRPSEYFARQCHVGSTLFSRAEAQARHAIGVDKITIGADYPHHEGTWGAGPGTLEYLQATLGAVGTTVDEARAMLGGNAIPLWGLDHDALTERANRIGHTFGDILTPPTQDWYPRGDVHKPLTSFGQ